MRHLFLNCGGDSSDNNNIWKIRDVTCIVCLKRQMDMGYQVKACEIRLLELTYNKDFDEMVNEL
jgi:hypothetical protein